jgi:hypothetical protein
VKAFELVVAGLLLIGAVRSALTWRDTTFEATGARERILFAAHVVSRVALWVAFAGFFIGYALLDEPQSFKWYFLVPIALAGVQLMTGLLLARSPAAPRHGER